MAFVIEQQFARKSPEKCSGEKKKFNVMTEYDIKMKLLGAERLSYMAF